MGDGGEQDPFHTVLHSDNCILVASLTALVLLTGSALIWRSKMCPDGAHVLQHESLQTVGDVLSPGEKAPHSFVKNTLSESHVEIVTDEALSQEGDSKDSKNSRSKERRRRRKDPLKEMFKGGKKIKPSNPGSRPSTGDSEAAGNIPFNIPLVVEPGALPRSRDREGSVATSSRSVSSASSSRKASGHPVVLNFTDQYVDRSQLDVEHAVGTDYPSSSISLSQASDSEFHVVSGQGLLGRDETPVYLLPNDVEKPMSLSDNYNVLDASHVSPTEYDPSSLPSSSGSTDSEITFDKSPATSAAIIPTVDWTIPNAETILTPSQTLPSYPGIASSPSGKNGSRSGKRLSGSGSWDWDGANSTSTNDNTYRKPPRFRSRSPMPLVAPVSYATPVSNKSSNSPSTPSSSGQVLLPSSISGDPSIPFIFPSLDQASSSSVSSPVRSTSPVPNVSSTPSRQLSANGNGSTPRRVPTPRRTPTPSGSQSGTSTPPPLSTQTQIASMRGALEAARMREEKAKQDLEKYAKECEILRWESTVWRRREVELQTQVHHLMHQLQGYAGLLASIQTSAASNPLLHLQISNQTSPSPQSPHSQLQMLSNGMHMHPSLMHAQAQLLSPHLQSPSHSPFFAYQNQPQSHSHPQSQPPLSPQPPQSNLFSMLFPLAGTASGPSSAGPSSVSGSGTSSVGSMSPDLGNNSLSPFDRDRGRGRTRLIDGRVNRYPGSGEEEWIAEGDEENAEDTESQSGMYEEESEFSEVLADAILKRPNSIRIKSRGTQKEKEKRAESEHTIFTFPSISNHFTPVSGDGGAMNGDRDERNQMDQVSAESEGVSIVQGITESFSDENSSLSIGEEMPGG